MARDPGSLWSPLTENGRQGSYTKTQFIVHSTGDRATAAAIFGYFNRANVVVESTFVVGRGPEDPTRQLLDSASGADANLGANQRAISVEVVGTADDDYTEWQVQEIVRLGRWARANHPIEARICPTHNTSGCGWHVMFGSPGPWTPVAKACPGGLRIQRLRERIFPAIFNNTTSPAPAPVQEDDMKLIQSPSRGTAVVGPGFFRPLNAEEAGNAPALYGQPVVGNDRQFDLWRSVALSGEGTPRQVGELHGKVVDSRLGTEGRPGPDADDMLGHILSIRGALAELATGGVDVKALTAEILKNLDVKAAVQEALREGTGASASSPAA